MGNKWGKDLLFKIDNSSATLTAIHTYLNSANLQAQFDILDETAFGDENPDISHGIARMSIAISGFVNSTTEGIFGPLVGNNTSISKTYMYYNGVKAYTGECLPDSVDYSGSPESLLTFSANLMIDGAVTRTSSTT